MNIAVYPGSFDPLTSGHMDIIKKAARVCDVLYVAVLRNAEKTPVFSVEERLSIIEAAAEELSLANIRVESFSGLLAEFVKSVQANLIVRGLRNEADFEYESQIAAANKRLAPEAETVFFMASPELAFLSSGLVRDLGYHGGSLNGLVPSSQENFIRERLLRR